jgi:hypothetical protein
MGDINVILAQQQLVLAHLFRPLAEGRAPDLV